MFDEINIELTNRCQKKCWICPRWTDGIEKKDIQFMDLINISEQLEDNIIVHFHNSGEPLLYPHLKDAFQLFKRQIRHFDTNGILLVEKANQIDEVDIISISIIEDDPVYAEQLKILKEYLSIKPRFQRLIARCVGKIDEGRMAILNSLGIPIVRRVLHDPNGRTGYSKEVIKPEDMICRDFLGHPTIDVDGDFHICTKYDPNKLGVIGNIRYESISDIWNGDKRIEYLRKHIAGERNEIEFCKSCEYYGCPNG